MSVTVQGVPKGSPLPADAAAEAPAASLLRRRRLVLAVGVTILLALAGATALARAHPQTAPGTWECSSGAIATGPPTGRTARLALEEYLRSAGEPLDGWNLGEPNRFSRSAPGVQQVVSVSQTDANLWTVVRVDRCRRP